MAWYPGMAGMAQIMAWAPSTTGRPREITEDISWVETPSEGLRPPVPLGAMGLGLEWVGLATAILVGWLLGRLLDPE